MIEVEKIVVGFMGTNCYIVKDKDTDTFAIIDPGYRSKTLYNKIMEYGADKFKYILLTHGHFDHIFAAKECRDLTGSKIVISKAEEKFTIDGNLNLSCKFTRVKLNAFSANALLSDLETIMLGNSKITMISTPGHTSGSACYIVDDIIFSGDTLMKDTIGSTDFPTGDYKSMQLSLKRLGDLKGNFRILPGHGDETTLDYERNNNIYLGKINYEDIY